MSAELVRDVLGILVFLPAAAVWVIAMVDVLTRHDIGRRRRVFTAVVIGFVFPLALMYLLGRPPSSVRRGPESADDPRTALIECLEAGQPLDSRTRGWIEECLAGQAPPSR